MSLPSLPVIDAEDVTKHYGGVCALAGVSLQVMPGEVFGFLGPNGAGKSTFVRLLLQLTQPTSGVVRLFGYPARHTAARRSVGYLPEVMRAYEYLRVREFMRLHTRLAGIPTRAARGEIRRCLDRTGIADLDGRYIRGLSKGQVQRLGLAQALLGNPRLLLLDEPVSGLDPIGTRDLRDLLQQLRGEGVTVFLNSHNLTEVERVCDRVAILNHGRILRIGRRDDLSASSDYIDITVPQAPADFVQQLERRSGHPVTRSGDTLRVRAVSDADSLELHRMVHAAGLRLVALQRSQESLEDIFYRVVKESA